MKANQNFRRSDEAVSPVIGVILMVAITVVLAAVVFVLVGNLTDTSEAAPSVQFIKSENGTQAGGVLTVQSIQNGPIDLNFLVVGGSANTSYADKTAADDDAQSEITCHLNGEPLAGGIPSTLATQLRAGDQILCGAAGTITVSYTNPEALLYSGEFE